MKGGLRRETRNPQGCSAELSRAALVQQFPKASFASPPLLLPLAIG